MRYDIVEEILDDDLERRVRGTEHVELGSRKGKWGRLNIPKNLAAFVGIWHDSGRTFFMSAMKDSGEMNAGTRMSGRILGSHTNLRKVIWDSLLEPGLTSVKCSHARIHSRRANTTPLNSDVDCFSLVRGEPLVFLSSYTPFFSVNERGAHRYNFVAKTPADWLSK